MHIKVPLIPALLIGLIYIWQVNHIWDGFVLQEADLGLGWLVRVLAIGTVLTVLLILRTPKRLRLGAGLLADWWGSPLPPACITVPMRPSAVPRGTIRLSLWTVTRMTGCGGR